MCICNTVLFIFSRINEWTIALFGFFYETLIHYNTYYSLLKLHMNTSKRLTLDTELRISLDWILHTFICLADIAETERENDRKTKEMLYSPPTPRTELQTQANKNTKVSV